MVFKVVGNFDENVEKIVEELQKRCNFIVKNGIFYVSFRLYSKDEGEKKILQKILRPIKDFCIFEINHDNIDREEPFVANWCAEALTDLERQKYELEQQEKLRRVNLALDRMEEILQEQEND